MIKLVKVLQKIFNKALYRQIAQNKPISHVIEKLPKGNTFKDYFILFIAFLRIKFEKDGLKNKLRWQSKHLKYRNLFSRVD